MLVDNDLTMQHHTTLCCHSINLMESLHQQLLETITNPITGLDTNDIVTFHKNVLSFDISILKSIKIDDEKSTYLFGTSSSIIIFAMGMVELCKEQKDNSKLKCMLNNLHKLSSWDSEYVLGQQRYNGHLESHFKEATKYFEQLEQKKDSFSRQNLIQIRDKVVKDIFRIMRGENEVMP